ncbi:MAG: hypothetical protein JSW43_09120 [Gemmatimonadota bacterium]|nr:MAG: hypothetical protein JSW43_09120 [Gemmatimonadota bacterium]
MTVRIGWALGLVVGAWAGPLAAQQISPPPRTIDTIVIITQDPFTPEEAEGKALFRAMNKLHITTKLKVIFDELLFRVGEPFDPVKVQESERNLRTREIFKSVRLDTATVGGKFAVIVDTQDGWTTKPNLRFSVATDGTWTGRFGLTESNLLGRGNLASAAFVKEVDRQGLELAANFRRIGGSQVRAKGLATFWNDGRDGWWRAGDPFYSNLDRLAIDYDGQAAGRRVLRYRVDSAGTDTTEYRRAASINRLWGGFATTARPTRYLRLGAQGEIRQEKFVLVQDTGTAVPDSVYGVVGLWAEYQRTRFTEMRYFNGFGTEDIDVSTRVRLTVNIAPDAWGYASNGIGPQLEAAWGSAGRRGFFAAVLKANALFNDAGLDSGRVVFDLTLGTKFAERHSTALHIEGGVLENPPPGEEFDLGFNTPPRSWGAHSFVGTRAIWGTLEHRWYPLEALFKLISLGFAAFLDYGGAWYPDQEARFGGNIGIGLRPGGALGTAARTGRIDIGYRFGEGADQGGRLVLTFGGSIVFPWNKDAGALVKKDGP